MDIMNCTPIAQFAIGLDHKIIYWNRTCELLTGCAASDMIGTDHQWIPFYEQKRPVLADLIVSEDLEAIKRRYNKKKVSKSEAIPLAWQATDCFENLGGKPRHIFFVAAPALNARGEMIGAVETLQDITERVEAQRDLIASEKQYRMLTEKVPDGIILFQEGFVMFANRVCGQLFGFDRPEDLIGQKSEDFVAEESKEVFRTLRQDFQRGIAREKLVKIKCVKLDGKEFWVEAHNEFVQWDGKPAVLSTLQDITQNRIQEMAAAAERAQLQKENERLRFAAGNRYRFGNLIGKSQIMQEVYDDILKAAATEENVIILGESGTGKELAARAIHEMSERKTGEFVPVNCGAIPEALMESEFFGHKKGAFTGAVAETHGYLALAHGGVLFLDEVGDLPLNLQVKLLRVLEGQGYAPVGGNRIERSDCRIVAATHKDLKDLVRKGLMREDFFYRINVIPLRMPPLRDRREDISLLVEHFMKAHGKNGKRFFPPANILEALHSYDWPGNVRELENMLRRYLAVGRLNFPDNGLSSRNDRHETLPEALKSNGLKLAEAVERFEKQLVIKVLEQNRWHKAKAAAHLGISRRTLFRKIRDIELS